MAQLGTKDLRSLEDILANHPSATVNKAQGSAFNFEDPAEFLLATIGSAMFVEPKFYTDTENLEALKNHEFNTDGLDEQAVKILNACFQVANGGMSRDLVALAHWARKELNMRTVPQIMLAVAAHCQGTKQFVRSYVQNIAVRADEIRQVVSAYEHLFGWGAFPACLKKGVSDRMSKFTEYEVLKYNTKDHPSFADLLRFCDRRKNYPFSSAMREYILRGEVTDAAATPMLASRKALNSLTEWTNDVPALARRAGATWENLVSQFGSKPEVWELAATQMGYMALLRNLGNLLDANVSMATIQRVADKLSDQEAVANSKQLPFRFLSAYRVLKPQEEQYGIYRLMQGRITTNRDRATWDVSKVQVFVDAVEAALEHSIDSVPDLPGSTLIATDNSGSMSNMLSGKSVTTVRDVANVLCAILHKRCDDVQVVSFGEKVVPVTLSSRNSVLANSEQIAIQHNRGGGGHSTNAWKVIQHAGRTVFDRIVILSDMQCYDTGPGHYRGTRSVSGMLTEYRRQVNDQCFAHFFDLQGLGTKQTLSDNGLDNVVSGFSEKIFDQILVSEGTKSATSSGGTTTRVLPSLGYVRENF